jgi:RimJ/RimL family protein N-acetyltransferase
VKILLESCTVRSWSPEDAPSIARHANDREVWLNLRDGFPHPYGLQDAEFFIRGALQRRPETFFAIEVEGEAAGAIGYGLQSDVERVSAEIGYWLGRPFWGRGIMTEALRATTRHAVESHGLTRVYALPYEWNPASCRVLEKAGYVCECRTRRSAIKDGKVIDQYLYAFVPEP